MVVYSQQLAVEEIDSNTANAKLFVFGQLIDRYGVTKASDQLDPTCTTLKDSWSVDLRGLNPESVSNAFNFFYELSNPNFPPDSATFKRLALRHMVGYPSLDEVAQQIMAKDWGLDGIAYAVSLEMGGSVWVDNLDQENFDKAIKKAYRIVLECWLDGYRWNIRPSRPLIQDDSKRAIKNPFFRLEGETALQMVARYQKAASMVSAWPAFDTMLNSLINDGYADDNLRNEVQLAGQAKKQVLIDLIKQQYVAAYMRELCDG